MSAEDYDDLAAFADAETEVLVRVLRHSNDTYARACAQIALHVADNDFSIQEYDDAVTGDADGAGGVDAAVST